MARGTAEETETTTGVTSSRFVTGMIAMLGEAGATTEPAAEQIGQMCEADGPVVRSVQKWNCAPRKMTPRTNAKMRMRRVLTCMWLLRRSLGKNGCRVKCRDSPSTPMKQLACENHRLPCRATLKRCFFAPGRLPSSRKKGVAISNNYFCARYVFASASSGRSAPGAQTSASFA